MRVEPLAERLKLGLAGERPQLRGAPLLIADFLRRVEHVVHGEDEKVEEDAKEEDDGAGAGEPVGQRLEGRQQRERPCERRSREEPQRGRDERGDDECRRGREKAGRVDREGPAEIPGREAQECVEERERNGERRRLEERQPSGEHEKATENRRERDPAEKIDPEASGLREEGVHRTP